MMYDGLTKSECHFLTDLISDKSDSSVISSEH